jgi:hypothetical protein
MISFNKSKFIIQRKLILYSEKPNLLDGLLNEYMQSFFKHPIFGFKRFPKYTKIIDISSDTFKDSFSKTTLYEIRRATQDAINCSTTYDIDGYIKFYNKFLVEKKLSGLLSFDEVNRYGNAFVVRCANIEEDPLFVYHSYLYDSSIKRVRLLHSVSDIHNNSLTTQQKALLSKANRLLHYEDMIYFKRNGCLTYDFGGYAYETTDKSLLGINSFKDNFGGVLVEESNYYPFIFYLIKKLFKFFK